MTENSTTRPVWGLVGPRGSEIFEGDDGSEWEWARCHKVNCEHFVCHRLSDIWCWKHADSLPSGEEFVASLVKEKQHVG